MFKYWRNNIFNLTVIFMATKTIVSNFLFIMLFFSTAGVAFDDSTFMLKLTIVAIVIPVFVLFILFLSFLLFPLSLGTKEEKLDFDAKTSKERGIDIGEFISGWV